MNVHEIKLTERRLMPGERKDTIKSLVYQRENPEKQAKAITVRMRQSKRSKDSKEAQSMELKKVHKNYEKMIDQIMKKHIQEQRMLLSVTKINITNHSKTYRTIHQPEDAQSTKRGNIFDAKVKDNVSPMRRYLSSNKQAKQLIKTEPKSSKQLNQKRSNYVVELPLILKYERQRFRQQGMNEKGSLCLRSKGSIEQSGFEQVKNKIRKYIKSRTEG